MTGCRSGLVSEVDPLLGWQRWVLVRGRTAAGVMSAPVRAVHPDEPVGFVAGVLARTGMRRLFVTDRDGRLVGVSWRDLRSVRQWSCPSLPARVR